jgi:hypothetical protein
VSVSFAVGANYLAYTAGSSAAAGTGAFSLYGLVLVNAGNNNAGLVAGYASATLTRGVGLSGLHMYGPNDFSPSGFGTLTQSVWYEVMVTKSSSSAPWRMHNRLVNPGGSPGAWSHGVATSASNQGNGSAITEFRIGASGIAQANGLIAAWAAWTSELADALIDTIDGLGLASVAALSPSDLVSLENWAGGGSGSATLVGTTSYSSTTGTGSVGANPTGFSFAIGSSGAAPTGLAVPLGLGQPATSIPAAAPAGLALPLGLGQPTATLNRSAAPVGLAITIAFGTPAVALGRTAASAGLAVPLVFGVATLTRQSAAPTGLAIPLGLGQPAVAVSRSAAPAGLALPLGLGQPSAGAQAPYVTAVLTASALPPAVSVAAAGGSTLTPGAAAAATLTAGGL